MSIRPIFNVENPTPYHKTFDYPAALSYYFKQYHRFHIISWAAKDFASNSADTSGSNKEKACQRRNQRHPRWSDDFYFG